MKTKVPKSNKKKGTKSEFYLDRIFRVGRRYLGHSEEALAYLKSRGVSLDQARHFGLGYIPESEWPPYIDPETATEDEKFYWERSYKGSRLKGKLLFPMTNALGLTKAFQIRSPDSDIKDYWKFYSLRADIDALFFGTAQAMPCIWDTREVYLVEGIFDIFPVQQIFPNTLCCGTAEVGESQIKFLRRYVDTVHIMFDNDEYGDRFFSDFYYEYRNEFDHINRVSYAGKDPSDSWKRLGPEKFQQQFDRELSFDLSSSHAGPFFRGV